MQPTPDDVLVTLGDYVDRGPDTRGVLDRLIELEAALNLICLRGNHEQMMVEARDGGRSEQEDVARRRRRADARSYGIVPAPRRRSTTCHASHWDFLENDLVDYHETERFIFVHATVLCDFDMARPARLRAVLGVPAGRDAAPLGEDGDLRAHVAEVGRAEGGAGRGVHRHLRLRRRLADVPGRQQRPVLAGGHDRPTDGRDGGLREED